MTEPPEIVFCTHDSPTSIGGPFTWLHQLLPSLREAGHHIRVLALTHFGGTGPVVEGLRQHGFDVRVTDCPDRTEDGVRWILSQLGSTAPAIFVPNFVVPALFAARWVREAGGVTVGVLHSDDGYYRAIQREFVQTKSPFQLTDIITVSESLQNEVLQQRPPNGLRSTYIPYGVHTPDAIERLCRSGLRIAYVGRLAEEQKRISLVAQAMVAAAEQIPGTECVIFGDGPDREKVLQILRSQTTGIPVTAPGPLKYAEVQKNLLSFDVIVLLSDYEGLPISLLEGMACGCVPICRQMRSGIPQLVRHQETGLIVSEKVPDFVNGIRQLTRNRSHLTRMRTAARQMIHINFSDQLASRLWSDFLKDRISERKLRRIAIPPRMKLPPARPELESPESRKIAESQLRRSFRRLRITIGAIRRKWF